MDQFVGREPVASTDLCTVCIAKVAGAAPPKRKCSCRSGLTAMRNHTNRCEERRERGILDYLLKDFEDKDDPTLSCAYSRWPRDQAAPDNASGYELFDHTLQQAELKWCRARQARALRFLRVKAEADRDLALLSSVEKAEEKAEADAASGDPLSLYKPVIEKLRSWLASDVVRSAKERYARAVEGRARDALVSAVRRGDEEVVKFWLDDYGLDVDVVVAEFETMEALSYVPDEANPYIGMTPLYAACYYGTRTSEYSDDDPRHDDPFAPRRESVEHVSMVQMLLARRADPNFVAREDGTTPAWRAAAEGCASILSVLSDHGADLSKPNLDGTAPAHVAAAEGHWGVLEVLHDAGVNMDQAGSIYLDPYDVVADGSTHRIWPLGPEESCSGYLPGYMKLQTSMTPLMIARQMLKLVTSESRPLLGGNPWACYDREEMVRFMEENFRPAKRVRSTESMEERAARVGILDRLKPISPSLRQAAQAGSQEAKKELQKLQVANQQIVSRAEARAPAGKYGK